MTEARRSWSAATFYVAQYRNRDSYRQEIAGGICENFSCRSEIAPEFT